jgi:hypothetical protein
MIFRFGNMMGSEGLEIDPGPDGEDGLLLADGTSFLLLADGVSSLILASTG